MPSGAKPKVYDPVLIERVRAFYEAGHTQAEVAALTGLTTKVVFNVMRRGGIVAPANSYWKGDGATYEALHKRVEQARGRPSKCEQCGTERPAANYDWANLTGNYADVNDYKRMCRSCHRKFDNQRRLEAKCLRNS